MTDFTNFCTQALTAIVEGPSPGLDPVGVPIPGELESIDIAAWYNPATNQDVTQAAADQTLVSYVVLLPNVTEVIGIVERADTLLLDGLGPYEIVGRMLVIPDGFELPGYLQLNVDWVRG